MSRPGALDRPLILLRARRSISAVTVIPAAAGVSGGVSHGSMAPQCVPLKVSNNSGHSSRGTCLPSASFQCDGIVHLRLLCFFLPYRPRPPRRIALASS